MYAPNLGLVQFGDTGTLFFAQAYYDGSASLRVHDLCTETAAKILYTRPDLTGVAEFVAKLLKDRPEDRIDMLGPVNHVLHVTSPN